MAARSLWQCPACKRKFAKRGQWHSCRTASVDSHFKGKPPSIEALFQELRAALSRFGPLRVDAVQSSINFAATSHLGGVRVQKDGLRVGFVLSRPLESGRVIHSLRLGPTTHAHAVKLTSRDELDGELLGWLKEAYTRSS